MAESPMEEPVQDPNNIKNKHGLVHFAALLLLSAASAGTIGSMIEITQYDSVVIAAVIPVLLTAGWGIISLKFTNLKHDRIDHNLIAITVALIFFLYILTFSTNYNYHRKELIRMQYLEYCSSHERLINDSREAIKLPPLDSSYFCKK